MNFKRYHVSKNLADLYNISKRALSLDFTTGDNMTVVINGTKSSGNNIIDIKDTSFVLPAGTYTVKIKMVSGTITEISDGVYFGINRSDYGQRTTPGIKQIGDVGTRTFILSSDTTITSFNIAPSYSSVGAVFDDATFECWLYEGSSSDDIPYEPYGNTWTDIPHYFMGTATDTITTLPADIYANDTTATVGLKGDMEQSSTPSPTTPIQPQECGERTGNLFDANNFYSEYKTSDGIYSGQINQFYPIKCKPFTSADIGKTFTFSLSVEGDLSGVNFRVSADINGVTVNGNIVSRFSKVTFTVETVNDAVYVNYGAYGTRTVTLSNIMLNLGSTPLSYEPYGYKNPILNNSQTTNVYLGEVQSTRRIKKLVLTGQETEWQQGEASGGRSRFLINVSDAINADTSNPYSICSHLPLGASGATYSSDNVYTFVSGKLYMRLTVDYDTLVAFKTYLAQQYAAGTPVTVWYVLATPTTAIVNEPLRKIGTYADEVSGISIPTIAGANTLSVDTTLQPSEVSVNYKGWHPVVNVHERENGAWT